MDMNCKDLKSYIEADNHNKKRAFFHYLVDNHKAISTSVVYSEFCDNDKTVNSLAREMAGTDSLYEIVDDYIIARIYMKAGKRRAAVRSYRDFILYLTKNPINCLEQSYNDGIVKV